MPFLGPGILFKYERKRVVIRNNREAFSRPIYGKNSKLLLVFYRNFTIFVEK